MIYEKSCGAVIFAEQNGSRLYLVERMQKGHFSMCKGHVEGEETEHQTASREIREETGLAVEFLDGFRKTIGYSPNPDCQKTVVFFLAHADSTNVTAQEEEIQEILWLPFAGAAAALTFDSDREILRQAEAFLEGRKPGMLTVYKPRYEDLWFRQQLLADEATMTYNHAWGGTIAFPKERWQSWYDFWVRNPEGQRYYRYLKNEAGDFIGEIAYHYDDDDAIFLADVIVYARYRGKGFGGQALDLLCGAAKENGVSVLYDDIAIDNPAISLFLKHGFREERRTKETVYLRKEL